MAFSVDDAKYVIDRATDARVLLGEDGKRSPKGLPILLYQEEIRDQAVHILNPLAGGLGQPPSALWFYRALNSSLLLRIRRLIEKVVEVALAEKTVSGDGPKEDVHIPMDILNLATKILDDIDDKVLGEIAKIFANETGNEFLILYYKAADLRTLVRSGLFDKSSVAGADEFKSKFPQVRKKTWSLLERLLLGIFQLNTGEEFFKYNRKSDNLTCPRLSSRLNVLLAIYTEINPLLRSIGEGEFAIDLSELAMHINNLDAYTDNAKWMVTPSARSTKPTSQTNGVGPRPTDTSSAAADPNIVLIPGQVYSDGRQDPPIAINKLTGMVVNQPVVQQPAFMFPPPAPVYGQQSPFPASPASGYFNQGGGQQSIFPPPFSPPYQQIPINQGSPVNRGFGMVPGMPPSVGRY